MMVSTKGRYALRVMIDLIQHGQGAYLPLKEVSARQEISQKYLESIMLTLSKAGLVEGAHGKGGGYRLTRSADDYRVGEILRLTEGSIAPVTCLSKDSAPCPRAKDCPTLPMWETLDGLISEYLDGVRLTDLIRSPGQ